ncbi:MAG: septum site-determining protein MinC [Pigmentiphaga sp.]
MNVPAVLDFKSASLYALRLVLRSSDAAALVAALEARLDAAGDFFIDEPTVIDAHALEQPTDWQALASVIRQRGLALVGVSAPDALRESISTAGLSCVTVGGGAPAAPTDDTGEAPVALARDAAGVAEISPAMPESESAESPATPETGSAQAEATGGGAVATSAPATPAPAAGEFTRPTLILDRSLRSGQKVYARQADLVVIGMVSPGAEVIADGNIHVYGALRGKAMAGARGDEGARIFATQLDAELVAVAGVYRVVETRLPADIHQKPATVRLRDGQLQLQALVI